MPISYSIDTARRVVFTRWEGVVTADDLAAHCKRLFSDERAFGIDRSVTDMRGATVQFMGKDMRRVINDCVTPELRGRQWRTAVITDQTVHYGITRQFQAEGRGFATSEIFRDEAAALAWLLAP